MNDLSLLQKPVKEFTQDLHNCFCILTKTFDSATLPFLEDDCIIAYVSAGTGTILINGIPFLLKPGTICLLHSYHVFQITPDAFETLTISFLVSDYILMSYSGFSSSNITNTTEEIKNIFYLPPVIYPNEQETSQFKHLFQEIESECHLAQKHSLLIRYILCMRISLLYHYICSERPRECAKYSPTPTWNLIIYLTVYGHYSLKAKEVASHFQLSERQLNTNLRQITAMNFSQFLLRSRINYACAALMLKNVSLLSIAHSSGFTSETTFYRAFRELRNTTPENYRKQIATIKYQNSDQKIDDSLFEIYSYIINHFREPISLQKMCEDLYISKNTAVNTLKQKMNTSFQQMLVDSRLRYAEGLLLVSPLPIQDIASHSGFQSVHTFIRIFKKKYILTPSEYRKIMLQEENSNE